MSALSDTALAGWPLAATLALALAGGRLRAGRRRVALNRALHELRRPLQALAITPGPREAPGAPAPLELAIAALGDLDREINGGGSESATRPVSCRELVGSAVGRWRARATLAGGSIALGWRSGDAVVIADPTRLSQALDNLIVNALQHGGPNVVVEARCEAGRLRIAVVDDGCVAPPSAGGGNPAGVIARIAGWRRNGHGLSVVRQVAAAHRGRFALHRSDRGSVAMLELPLAGAPDSLAA